MVRRGRAVSDRYGDDGGGYLAASIAYYGFLSFFPLILLGLAIVGFFLAANPALRAEVEAGLTRSVPGVDALVGRNLRAVQDARVAAGVIGLVGLLWSGTGVVGAGRNAVRIVFREGSPRGGLGRSAWRVAVTAGLGILALVATALGAIAASIETEGFLGAALRVLVVLLVFGLDFVLFFGAYRTLRRDPTSWPDLVPGAIFAAIGWTALKLLGTWYASWTVRNSESVYGTFAATVGVLVILYLTARLFVYGAELNAVLIEERGGIGMGNDRGNGGRPATDPRELSTTRLVGRVAGDVGTLVKKEAELARQEITEGISAKMKGAAAFAAAAALGLFVLGFLGAAGAAALALVMPTWAALLIVAGGFVLLAGGAALFGMAHMKRPVAPEQAKRTIKEDVEWARAQLRR